MPDLALEYLQELGKKKLATAVTALMPLELALTRLDLAALEAEEGRRAAHQARARAEFEAFVKKNAKHPRVAEANLQIARLAALQGKTQLTVARRQETKEVQRGELLRARAKFEEAARLLKAAAGQIDKQLSAIADPQTSESQANQDALAQAKHQAEFELGLNLLDQAQTFTQSAELQARGQIVKSAIDVLGRVAARDNQNPLCWQAKAWQGFGYYENDDPKSARKIFQDVIGETGDAAETAKRFARYFRLKVLAKDPDVKKPVATLQQIQESAERWLVDYRKYRNTPEALGVRFELANACLKHAALLGPKEQVQARELFTRAQKLYQELEQTDSEYAEAARENKLNIILKISSERTRGDIGKLKDFDECYIRAQFDISQLNKAEKELSGQKLEARRKELLGNILAALNRALDLADTKVPVQDLTDARYLMARALFATGDYYRAAVQGEELARSAPQAMRAPGAGSYALYAYTQLLAEDEQTSAGPETLEADRTRLRALAEYVERTWPSDPSADLARHQLGRLLLLQKLYPEAVEVLSRISPVYSDATRALYQLAYAALQAQKVEAKPPAGKPGFQQQAVAALKSIPELAATADGDTAQIHLEAKLTLGTLLYGAKDFKQTEAIADTLLDRLATLQGAFDAATRSEFETKALGLKLLAKYGQADADYLAGSYSNVRDALDPLVNLLKDSAQAARYAQVKDPDLLPALLSLAVRANVQDNKIDQARAILQVLQKSAPGSSMLILKQLVLQLRLHIQALRDQGPAVKEQLEQTIANFSTFLDQLSKEHEKEEDAELVFFLAQSYSSLDNHKKAAELLDKVAEPKPTGKEDVDAKQTQIYRAARIMRVRELRLDKQYDRAKASLDKLLAGPADKPSWAQQNLDVQKERIFLLQDQERYGGPAGAVQAWSALMKQLKPRIESEAKLKEQYFECYFHLTHCLFKNASKLTDEKKKAAGIRVAANYIVQLENTQSDMGGEAVKRRFEELLRNEKALRQQYDVLRKGSG